MNIVEWSPCNMTHNGVEMAKNIKAMVRPQLIKTYCRGDERTYEKKVGPNLSARLVPVSYLFPDGFDGKKVLDLGCGSVDSLDSGFEFEPWLSRALHLYGIKVIGIDISPRIVEEWFENYCRDLMQGHSLDMLPDHSIDVAVAFALFDSPHLRKNYGDYGGDKLQMRLECQLERVLKPNGTFIYH